MRPVSLLKWLMGVPIVQAIYIAAKLRIADHLKEGQASCRHLAEVTSSNEDALYRILRMLVSIGLVAEVSSRQFALAPLGKYLQEDHPDSVYPLAIMNGEPWHLRPWTHLLESVRTGRPAFNDLYGMGFFEYLAANPEPANIFNQSMESVMGGYATAVAAAFDSQGVSTVVDVGGGSGALLSAILGSHRHVRGVLFDLPNVVDDAHEQLKVSGLAANCSIIPGNFFESVPDGGDVYILSHVLHDWPDDKAQVILRNCSRAMQPHARLLVVEHVVNETPDFYGNWLNLEMLVNFGGKERTKPEYVALLQSAGLQPGKIIQTASPVTIIEAARGQS